MIANPLALQEAVKALRDSLVQYERVFATVPAQIDGARFCRDLLTQIDAALGEALEKPVTLEQAAGASGYSSDHLRRLIREGQLATYRLKGGHKHLVLLSEVPTRVRGARSAQSEEAPATPTAKRLVDAQEPSPGPAAHPAELPAAKAPAAPREALPALAPPPAPAYDPVADARSVLARVRGGKV